MKNLREETPLKKLFQGMPNEFPFIYKSIKNFTFYPQPNYQFFKDKLNDVISTYHGNNEDFCFTKDINK